MFSSRPPEQLYLDSSMRPADEPDNEEVKQAIYLWLDAKVSQKRAAKEMKQKHAQMLAALAEAGLDWHPYLDPFTQRKCRVWIAKEPKAKTSRAPTAPKEKRGRKRRGGPRRDADVVIDPDGDGTIETRRVPRKTVEADIDPFGSTRASMKGSVLEQAEAAQDGKPYEAPLSKAKKLPKRGKSKRGK